MRAASTTNRRARLLVVDAHEPCRRALADAVGSVTDEMEIVGLAADATEGAQVTRDCAADLVLLELLETDGPAEITSIVEASRTVRIVVVSPRDDGEAVFEAMRAGAVGLVPKTTRAEEIVFALERVAHGVASIAPALMNAALRWSIERTNEREHSDDRLARLSAREREILDFLSSGLTPRTIAERLVVSRRTVECHLINAYRKLHVHRQIEAIREYQKLRLA